ncbi:MAG: ABC transporter permease [Clostridia bacterium]|nr:ABC transporter permease [Clostridia bacterium]
MKNNKIWAIMRKEFARFFGDGRLVFTSILLPGLLIYLVYSFMGSAMGDMFGTEEGYVPACYAVNMPENAEIMLEAAIGGEIVSVGAEHIGEYKQYITDAEADLLMVFPEGADLLFGGAVEPSANAPAIALYYNSADTASYSAFQTVAAVLDAYESSVANLFDINAGGEKYDLASDEAAAGQIFAMMMPMLLMMFMFSGCMAVAPESIAGEKERGTIATLLITPMKRSHLALGKIFSLGVIAALSGVSSTVGTVMALPKLMNFEGTGMNMDASVYGITDYLMLGCVIVSTVLLLVSLISCISAFAKSIKEATTALTPVMIINMLIGVTAMLGSAQTNSVMYCIPLYNSAQCMAAIFSFTVNPVNIAITCGVNLAVMGVLVYLLTKMFDNEKVMFSV